MRASHVFHLGIKEFRSLGRDPMMVFFMAYAFTLAIYAAATAMPESINRAPIAVVDEDRSPLSTRIVEALRPPLFRPPDLVTADQMDRRMDAGLATFSLDIPPGFQRDVLAGRHPAVQLNVDATRMSQAFAGSGYIQQIVMGEVSAFATGQREAEVPVGLEFRMRFNPLGKQSWFGSIMEIVNNITMLSIVLTGAALIREREHGTVEHLLVMPVTPLEIMASKVWSMGLVVLAAATLSLAFVVQGLLQVPIEGSIALFVAGAALHLFATTSMGIFLATLARSMPQFGILLLLVLLPLEILSGGVTPRESMPVAVRVLMEAAPTTHFVALSQAILFRGAGLDVAWPHFVALAAIGSAMVAFSLARFRASLSAMAGQAV